MARTMKALEGGMAAPLNFKAAASATLELAALDQIERMEGSSELSQLLKALRPLVLRCAASSVTTTTIPPTRASFHNSMASQLPRQQPPRSPANAVVMQRGSLMLVMRA